MSVSLKQSYDIEYDGTANVARMDLFVDTAADLTGLTTFDSITLLQGSTAEEISTGDKYAMQTNGTWVKQPSQSAFANVYTKAEIDSMLYLYYTKTEADALFEWVTVTISTDTLPINFIADGTPLTAWTISGNGEQTGTPTPDNPVMPEFVGELDGADWTIPITCGGQTTPVYLGQTQTTRRIKKVVFNGTENWKGSDSVASKYLETATIIGDSAKIDGITSASTHYSGANNVRSGDPIPINSCCFLIDTGDNRIIYLKGSDPITLADFKAYLAAQYAAGTPVTVWFVLETEQTGIINEPLAKISDYADELHSTDAGVNLPTAKGANTLTVGTTLPPSEVSITGKIREVNENEQ